MLKGELEALKENTAHVLYKKSAVFPIQLFPDTIIVDKNKVEIIYKSFFWSKYIFTILVEDIVNVKISTGPFFSNIFFEVKGYEENPQPLYNFWKKDALELKDIVVGLVKLKRDNIDPGEIKNSKVKEELKAVGKMHENINAVV